MYQPNFVYVDEVSGEIKALDKLSGVDQAQLINYLKATALHIGLLINFDSKSLEYKRLVYNLRESA